MNDKNKFNCETNINFLQFLILFHKYIIQCRQQKVESNQPKLGLGFPLNILKTKSQTVNILGAKEI